MDKKSYKKPTVSVVELQNKIQLLYASSKPTSVPWWGGEGG